MNAPTGTLAFAGRLTTLAKSARTPYVGPEIPPILGRLCRLIPHEEAERATARPASARLYPHRRDHRSTHPARA